MFTRMAIRDVSIVAVALALWWGLADHSAGDGMLADLTGLVAGLLLGVSGYLLHEWGHLTGALATGAKVDAPARLTSGFLFSFDSKANDKRQFLVMSFSGFAMTFLVVWAFYTFLPDGLLASHVARGVAALGLLLVVVVEMPLVVWGLVGKGLPPVENSAARRREPVEPAAAEGREAA